MVSFSSYHRCEWQIAAAPPKRRHVCKNTLHNYRRKQHTFSENFAFANEAALVIRQGIAPLPSVRVRQKKDIVRSGCIVYSLYMWRNSVHGIFALGGSWRIQLLEMSELEVVLSALSFWHTEKKALLMGFWHKNPQLFIPVSLVSPHKQEAKFLRLPKTNEKY